MCTHILIIIQFISSTLLHPFLQCLPPSAGPPLHSYFFGNDFSDFSKNYLRRITFDKFPRIAFDLALPFIRPFANSARQDRQTPWWAALAQQAQPLTSAALIARSDLDAEKK